MELNNNFTNQIGTFEFRNNNGVAEYRKSGADTWIPFKRFEKGTFVYNESVSQTEYSFDTGLSYISDLFICNGANNTGRITLISVFNKDESNLLYTVGACISGHFNSAIQIYNRSAITGDPTNHTHPVIKDINGGIVTLKTTTAPNYVSSNQEVLWVACGY